MFMIAAEREYFPSAARAAAGPFPHTRAASYRLAEMLGKDAHGL
jgi:hypothetical protein